MKTKKLMSIIVTIVMMFSLITITADAAKVGDVVGYAQPTDIVATINGYQLESYNVDGYTYICVEDLRYYGFNVVYDNYSRSLSVNRNYSVGTINPQQTNPKFWNIGSNSSKKKILYTDIQTYLSGYYVGSCNINGQTIIRFDSLSSYGAVAYDNNRREISLTISNMNYNPIATLATEITNKGLLSDDGWTSIVRAKGDMLVIINRSTTVNKASTASNTAAFKQSVQRGDIYNSLSEILSIFRSAGYPVSSLYSEYYSGSGEKVTSVQIY